MVRRFLKIDAEIQAVRSILHLPLVQRLTHHKARKPLVAVSLGVCVMLIGSSSSVYAGVLSHATGLPHVFIDAAAYFVHGCGTIPVLKYVEPVWVILQGEKTR